MLDGRPYKSFALGIDFLTDNDLPMKTRDRILATSLTLFNESGEPNVTTVDVAHEMDISPGNLYYHFRNKEDIIHALFKQFETAMADTMEAAATGMLGLGDYALMLELIFETQWEYRFFYRDLNHLLGKDAYLKKHFSHLLEKQRKATFQVLKSYAHHKAIRATLEELNYLVTQILFILTFSMNYQQLLTVLSKEVVITTGVAQINQLILPYRAA